MSKYKNKEVVIDGIKFDSKHEAEYYVLLKKQKEEGKIKDFKLQQKFELQPAFKKNGKSFRAITYTVDFSVLQNDDTWVHIDVKGMETQQGIMRKKMFDYLFDEELIWIQKSLKYGDENGWIEYGNLKKKRAAAKKEKAKATKEKEEVVKVKKVRKVAK